MLGSCRVCDKSRLELKFVKGKNLCVLCESKRRKKHYRENKEAEQQRNAEYYKKNRTYIIEKVKEYISNNQTTIKKRQQTKKYRDIRRLSKMRHRSKYSNLSYIPIATAKDLKKILDYQENRCLFCCQELENREVEHLVPISRGGSNLSINLAYACRSCNMDKFTKTLEEYRPDLLPTIENRNLLLFGETE